METLLMLASEAARAARLITPSRLQMRRARLAAWLADKALSARLESRRKRAAAQLNRELRRMGL